MNIAVLREGVFYEYYSKQTGGFVYEHCSTERGGFFKNNTVIREAVLFYEYCNNERGGFL
jgi:hypothetical protein